jgi:uncharacterized repeat protein (TIGR01451 family)
MQRIIGVISRLAALTIVALLCGAGVAAAQTKADLEVYIQKVPVTDDEATDFPITYSINVWNAGSGDAQNVVLTDSLPAEVAFVSASQGCVFDAAAHMLTCNLGLVRAKVDVFVDLVVRTPSSSTTIVNTARVSSSTPDPDPADNSMTVSVDVIER